MLLHSCPSTHTPRNKSTLRTLSVVSNTRDERRIPSRPPFRNPGSMVVTNFLHSWQKKVVEEEQKEQTSGVPHYFWGSFSVKTDIKWLAQVLRIRNWTVGMSGKEHKKSVLYTCSALWPTGAGIRAPLWSVAWVHPLSLRELRYAVTHIA